MYKRLNKLTTPADFNFPFKPYEIQQQLMSELYSILERKEIGIFESPTGTGKSLTLTCAALRWLEDHENEVKRELSERLDEIRKQLRSKEIEKSDKNWFDIYAETTEIRENFMKLQEIEKSLREFEEQIQLSKKGLKDSSKAKGQLLSDMENHLNDDNVNVCMYRPVQIYFCSRTHTQLAQIVQELKQTVYGKRIRCITLASRQYMCINEDVKSLNNATIINERCLDLIAKDKKNASSGQEKKRKKLNDSTYQCSCRYRSQFTINCLSNISLYSERIMDIEDLVRKGTELKACPYYASRKSIETAQLILLPYQLLLQHKTRKQMGMNLKDNIIMIDEAHNLLNAMVEMYSCELNLHQLELLQEQITTYKKRYATQFHATNLLSINQILFIIKSLIKMLQSNGKDDVSGDGVKTRKLLSPLELMSEGEFFNINIYDLIQFCERTRFSQKLYGFLSTNQHSVQQKEGNNEEKLCSITTTMILKRLDQSQKQHSTKKAGASIHHEKFSKRQYDNDDDDDNENNITAKHVQIGMSQSPIRLFLQFLECLMEKAENGRILICIANKSGEESKIKTTMKYLLLNPRECFQSIVDEARAIIIAGGTMQPTEELIEQLFSSCRERVKIRCYDHVVPANAILPMIITQGPSGRNLRFNFTERLTIEMLNDLTSVLENLSNVVPGGLVCFFPSHDYLDLVYNHLESTGSLNYISTKKCVFRETQPQINYLNKAHKRNDNNVQQLLDDYAKAIRLHKNHGALLLSVIGGKLSEGLNFTNDLGRGVIVVGLPYANRQNSPELQERISYIEKTFSLKAGQEYYENLCMKAVNQCIGRAVRHINDFACVYLLDERYNKEYIKKNYRSGYYAE